jgi:hypothetical protein
MTQKHRGEDRARRQIAVAAAIVAMIVVLAAYYSS